MAFWKVLYLLMPPREIFGNSPGYHKLLQVIDYYGNLNLRSLTVQLYGATPTVNGKPQEGGNGGAEGNPKA